MTFFSAKVFSLFLLLANPALSSSSLRAVSQQDRRLSYELIAYYEPRTQVTDHNAIDLDQAAIEAELGKKTDQGLENARKIYSQGGNSKSVAMVNLGSPLVGSIKKGTVVTGKNADGSAVYGKVYDDYINGVSTIGIQYKTSDIQNAYVTCQVGGLTKRNLAGCLAASGSLDIDGNNVDYSYDPRTGNVNKRTIQKFSTDAEDKMYRCQNCPYETYRKYRDYYGVFDYGDKWITAAFEGKSTSFGKGNANFAQYGFNGKVEAIKKGTAYMNIWMYVIREMEDALDDCQKGCQTTDCNDDAVHAWDEAVAFYVGSLEGNDGQGSGKLLYALADKRCSNFKTCGELAQDTDGTAHVNTEVMREFNLGARKLARGQCAETKPHKERIERMMTVPLIQGTLRYAYITSTDPEAGEKAEAEGAVFAAAVLPLVHACDEEAADTIYKNMKTGQGGSADFGAVKAAFEEVYECMGIRGADVGGLWNGAQSTYYPGASPLSSTKGSGNTNLPLIIGCTAGGLVLGIIIYFLFSRGCGSAQTPVEEKEDPMASSEEEEPEAKLATEDDPLPSTNSELEPVEIS